MRPTTTTLSFVLMLQCALVQSAPEMLEFNTGVNNRDITFSPAGDIMLSTVTSPKNHHAMIVVSYQQDDRWSDPVVAPFSGKYPDIEPAFAPDGRTLFFASRRPKPGRDDDDWDIWQVPFHAGLWGAPIHLGDNVNTNSDEFYPSVTSNGVLYFTASRSDTLGKEDLYRAKPIDGKYAQVENIGAPVNSKAFEFNAFIAPDETYLIFGAQRRQGETGGGDLYISYRHKGIFSEPQLLSAQINTIKLDYCPTVFNGYLYFTSERLVQSSMNSMQEISDQYLKPGNGFGDIYRIPFSNILD